MAAITKFFVGGEVEAFAFGSHASITWSTAAGLYDSQFARGAVYLQAANSGYLNVPLTSTQLNAYYSLKAYHDTGLGNATACTWFQWYNADLVAVYRVQGVGGTLVQPIIQLQYWSGSAWVAVGIPLVVPILTLHKYDFYLNIANAGGTLAMWVDGVPMGSLTGDTLFVSPSPIREMRVFVTSTTGFTNIVAISEVQVLDVSTLGRRLATLGETADGANVDWTGAVADINTTGTYTDGTFIQTGSAGQDETYITTDLSATAQTYLVDSLVVAGRALKGAVGPQNLYGLLRIGGVDYASTNPVTGPNGLVTDFQYVWADFPNNPATGIDFTPADVNALETGWRSAA